MTSTLVGELHITEATFGSVLGFLGLFVFVIVLVSGTDIQTDRQTKGRTDGRTCCYPRWGSVQKGPV